MKTRHYYVKKGERFTMTRDEMLGKLHSIPIGAQPTVATMDMGLQYEYVTSEGYGENLGSMGDWPVWAVHGITNGFFQIVKEKVTEGTLTVDDIDNTELKEFYDYVFKADRLSLQLPAINEFFNGLTSVESVVGNTLYILCDARSWEPEATFFARYDELAQAFIDNYSFGFEEWDDLDDDELEHWIDKIESELSDIYMIEISHDDKAANTITDEFYLNSRDA